MGGKTKIGGTEYDVNAAKSLVGGTLYRTTKGKALVGGTARTIYLRRKVPVTITGDGGSGYSVYAYAQIDGIQYSSPTTQYAYAGDVITLGVKTSRNDFGTGEIIYNYSTVASTSEDVSSVTYNLVIPDDANFLNINLVKTESVAPAHVVFGRIVAFTIPSYEQLFGGLSVHATAGRNSSTTGTVSIPRSSAPLGTSYLLTLRPTSVLGAQYASLGIFRIENGSITKTVYDTSSYGISISGYYQTDTDWYYATSPNASSASSVYGVTMAIITFPSGFSTDEIESTLSTMSCSRLASRYSSSLGAVTLSAQNYNFAYNYIIISKNNGFDIVTGYIDSGGNYWVFVNGSSPSQSVSRITTDSSGYYTLATNENVYVAQMIGIRNQS